MAITILTKDPSRLLSAIRKAIEDGKIDTWEVDKDGDFVHTPDQWKNEAWLRPSVDDDKLLFHTVGPNNKKITTTAYAVYHGRFIEMLLAHFDDKFSEARSSALPTSKDSLGGRRRSTTTSSTG